jgi:hypothetical protein
MATEKPTYLRRRKSGDIHQLRRVLWGCLIEIEALVLWGENDEKRLRAANSVAQLSGSYLKALEIADITERLERLEAAQSAREPTPIRKRYA